MTLHLEITIGEGPGRLRNLAVFLKRTAIEIVGLLSLGRPLLGNPHAIIDHNGVKTGSWHLQDQSRPVFSSEVLWVLHYGSADEGRFSRVSGPYDADHAQHVADTEGGLVSNEMGYKQAVAADLIDAMIEQAA